MEKDKINRLVKRLKEILEEADCYYSVTIAFKSSSLEKDNFATFGKGPVMQLITDTLTTLQEEDMSDDFPHWKGESLNKSEKGGD